MWQLGPQWHVTTPALATGGTPKAAMAKHRKAASRCRTSSEYSQPKSQSRPGDRRRPPRRSTRESLPDGVPPVEEQTLEHRADPGGFGGPTDRPERRGKEHAIADVRPRRGRLEPVLVPPASERPLGRDVDERPRWVPREDVGAPRSTDPGDRQ